MSTDKKPEDEAQLKLYSEVKIDLSNCILPDKVTEGRTPSELDGLDSTTETLLRAMGCELIQASGLLLKLPQTAMATAQVLYQRYFYSKSFIKHDMEMMSMAAIWLASKIEEEPRRARDIINVYRRIEQKRDGLEVSPVELDDKYVKQKEDLVKAERFMLKELGFCVHVKHPHKIIVVIICQILKCNENTEFIQTAWNFMNDSFRSRHLFVKYDPTKIACGCIFLAARVLQIPTCTNPYWFELFDVEPAEVFQICNHIMNLYTLKKLSILALKQKVKICQDNLQKEKNLRIQLLQKQKAEKKKQKENEKREKTEKHRAAFLAAQGKSGSSHENSPMPNGTSNGHTNGNANVDLRGSSKKLEIRKPQDIIMHHLDTKKAKLNEVMPEAKPNFIEIDSDSDAEEKIPDGKGGYIKISQSKNPSSRETSKDKKTKSRRDSESEEGYSKGTSDMSDDSMLYEDRNGQKINGNYDHNKNSHRDESSTYERKKETREEREARRRHRQEMKRKERKEKRSGKKSSKSHKSRSHRD